MDNLVSSLKLLSLDPSLAVSLYNRLQDLPPLSLDSGRLRLPGIVFLLTDVQRLAKPDSASKVIYRAKSPMLGDVEIKTTDDLIHRKGLRLIHPWITALLDQEFSHDPRSDLEPHALRLVVRLKQKFGALLLARERGHYRRVATDCFITVQVREETGLNDLMTGIQTVDML